MSCSMCSIYTPRQVYRQITCGNLTQVKQGFASAQTHGQDTEEFNKHLCAEWLNKDSKDMFPR